MPRDLLARILGRLRGTRGRPPAPASLQRVRLAALEAAPTAMFITDRAGAIQWVNAAFTRLSGYAPAEIVGLTPRVLRSGRQDAALYATLWRTILSGRSWRGRLVNRHKNGEVYDVEQVITPLVDPVGKLTHFLAIHEDLLPRLQGERRLLHEALYDPATDLPNWMLLRQRIFDAIARARRHGRFVAVMNAGFVESDDPAEREALRVHAARVIHGAVRETDFVGSHGALIVVVMEEFEQPGFARLPAERVLRRLAAPVAPLQGLQPAKAGLAIYPGDEASAEVLVQHAAEARSLALPGDLRFFGATQ